MNDRAILTFWWSAKTKCFRHTRSVHKYLNVYLKVINIFAYRKNTWILVWRLILRTHLKTERHLYDDITQKRIFCLRVVSIVGKISRVYWLYKCLHCFKNQVVSNLLLTSSSEDIHNHFQQWHFTLQLLNGTWTMCPELIVLSAEYYLSSFFKNEWNMLRSSICIIWEWV